MAEEPALAIRPKQQAIAQRIETIVKLRPIGLSVIGDCSVGRTFLRNSSFSIIVILNCSVALHLV